MSLKKFRLQCAVLVALIAAALPALAQYRWTDPSGQVSYGDAPPSDAKNVSRAEGRARPEAGDPTGGLPFELRKAMSSLPITLYTSVDCSPCDAARVWLRRRGAPYQEIVVDTDVDAEEMKRRVGTTAVPVMTLGRTPHLGFQDAVWSNALSAAGYPAQITLPPTYRPEPPKPILPSDGADRPAPGTLPAPKK